MKHFHKPMLSIITGCLLLAIGLFPKEARADKEPTPEIITKELEQHAADLLRCEQEILQAQREMRSFLGYAERLDQEAWNTFFTTQDKRRDYHGESFQALDDKKVGEQVKDSIARINEKVKMSTYDLARHQKKLDELKEAPQAFQYARNEYLSKLGRAAAREKDGFPLGHRVTVDGFLTEACRQQNGHPQNMAGIDAKLTPEEEYDYRSWRESKEAQEVTRQKRRFRNLSELLEWEKKRDLTAAIMDAEKNVLQTNARLAYFQKLLDDSDSWHGNRRPTFEEFFALKHSSWPLRNKPEESEDYLLQRGLAQDGVISSRDLIVRKIGERHALRWKMISLLNMWATPVEGETMAQILSPPYLERVEIFPAQSPGDIESAYRSMWSREGAAPASWELGLEIALLQNLGKMIFDDLKQDEAFFLSANQDYERSMKAFGSDTTYRNAINDFIKILDKTKTMLGYLGRADVASALVETSVTLYEEYQEGIKILELPTLSDELMQALEKHRGNPVHWAENHFKSPDEQKLVKSPQPEFALTPEQKGFVDTWYKEIKVAVKTFAKEELKNPINQRTIEQILAKSNPERAAKILKRYPRSSVNKLENVLFAPHEVDDITRLSRAAGKTWHHLKSIGKAELKNALKTVGKKEAAELTGWALGIDPEAEFIKAGWTSVQWLVARKQFHLNYAKYHRIEKEVSVLMQQYRDLVSQTHQEAAPTRRLEVDQPVPFKTGTYAMNLMFSRAVDLRSVKLNGRILKATLPPAEEFHFDFEISEEDIKGAKDGKLSLACEAVAPGETPQALDAEPDSIPHLPVFPGYLKLLALPKFVKGRLEGVIEDPAWANYQLGPDSKNHRILVERSKEASPPVQSDQVTLSYSETAAAVKTSGSGDSILGEMDCVTKKMGQAGEEGNDVPMATATVTFSVTPYVGVLDSDGSHIARLNFTGGVPAFSGGMKAETQNAVWADVKTIKERLNVWRMSLDQGQIERLKQKMAVEIEVSRPFEGLKKLQATSGSPARIAVQIDQKGKSPSRRGRTGIFDND